MKRITIPYFPTGLKYVTPILACAGIWLAVIGYPAWTAILVLVAVIILTTNYVTEINPAKGEYRDFLSFLSIPLQEERVKFVQANRIIITKENHKQTQNSRARSTQLNWSSFTASLIVDDHKSLTLLTRNDKKELLRDLKEFASLLQVEVQDQTTDQYAIIDLSKY
jgi:hypothetical protein